MTDSKKLALEFAKKRGIKPGPASDTWFSFHEMVHFGEFVQQQTAKRCCEVAKEISVCTCGSHDCPQYPVGKAWYEALHDGIRAEFGVK